METKNEGIYDGFKQLGTGRMMVLGFQHVFAMFGATVLVPLLTGLRYDLVLLHYEEKDTDLPGLFFCIPRRVCQHRKR